MGDLGPLGGPCDGEPDGRGSARAVPGAKGAPARATGSPPGLLQPTARQAGAPLCRSVPPGVPPPRLRSPSSDSRLVAPLRNDHHRGVAVLMGVLCTRAVATGATLGCSRVAPGLRPGRGSSSLQQAPGPQARQRRAPSASPGADRERHRPSRAAVRCAQEFGNPGTRVALRNLRSKDSHDTNPGAGPPRARRDIQVEFQLPFDPPPAPGDRGRSGTSSSSSRSRGRPGRRGTRRARGSRWGTRCRPSAASSAPSSRSMATATRS